MLTSLILLLHLCAAIFWLGGMAFMLWVLRPSLMQTLEAAKRLAVLQAVLKRFFIGVWIAILIILSSGIFLFFSIRSAQSETAVHLMFTLGLVMSWIFAYIYFVAYKKFCSALDKQEIPQAAATLGFIQKLVRVNFFLGLLAIVLLKLW